VLVNEHIFGIINVVFIDLIDIRNLYMISF